MMILKEFDLRIIQKNPNFAEIWAERQLTPGTEINSTYAWSTLDPNELIWSQLKFIQICYHQKWSDPNGSDLIRDVGSTYK